MTMCPLNDRYNRNYYNLYCFFGGMTMVVVGWYNDGSLSQMELAVVVSNGSGNGGMVMEVLD